MKYRYFFTTHNRELIWLIMWEANNKLHYTWSREPDRSTIVDWYKTISQWKFDARDIYEEVSENEFYLRRI